MTDTKLLEFYIRRSGLKRGKLADSLGISMAALKKKTNGEREFKASEIKILCDMLGIRSSDEMERVFFTL